MLKIEITKNMTGIILSGDFYDLYELVETIYRMTPHGDDCYHSYYGVENRLLGFCYDVRHSYMGDRNIELVDNGLNEYNTDFSRSKTDDKTVYFACEYLLPEIMFLMCSLPELMDTLRGYYLNNYSYMQYLKDCAYMNMLITLFESVLYDIVGETEFRKIKSSMKYKYYEYCDYATHYVDKCNIEYLKTPVEKRSNKIKNIVKRLINKPEGYHSLKSDLVYSAKYHNCSIYDLEVPSIEYPNDVVW